MSRRKTRTVMVGNVGVGGDNPIRIQSMTTSNTRDVEATVEQILRLADSGCEIARVTVQGIKEAEACEGIKNGLVQRGYTIPLVADIHFYPPAAMMVAEFVDKVRINPGNFVDKRAQFKTIEYTDATYAQELEKIEEKFAPLVLKCKKLNRSMRIGTNHGSLSDRIMNWYGDTPTGMVESAIEFTHVARKYDYHEIIYSMKASNPLVMMEAYRLLVARMDELGWDYPLHLGVTEAGEGEDGRVKSAIGIGSLLLEGIGDTIRVSLTEDPWFEIDPCLRLKAMPTLSSLQKVARAPCPIPEKSGLHRDGSVIVAVSSQEIESGDFYENCRFKMALNRPTRAPNSCDMLLVEGKVSEKASEKLALLEKGGIRVLHTPCLLTEDKTKWHQAKGAEFVLFSPSQEKVVWAREFFAFLEEQKISTPIILAFHYTLTPEDLVIQASAENGLLLCGGLGEGIALRGNYPLTLKMNLSFSILQGCRKRSSKTDFISCPGCGRTLFDLQKVSAKIREKTAHLPGVKIAIMGCIVNGPGEMADADFGYVGSKPGKIDLYVGKTCVERDIVMEGAEDRLVTLIKAHGRWVDPNS